jgi:hypothetical protein
MISRYSGAQLSCLMLSSDLPMPTSIGLQDSVNKRSETYSIAHAMQRCASCARLTPVVGLLLPPGHETRESGAAEESAATDVWEAAEAAAMLFFIEYLPEAVQGRLHQLSQYYRLDDADTGEPRCWVNHCTFCGSLQGDFDLYCEPEGAFSPISEEAAVAIRFHEVLEPFEALAGGYVLAPEFLTARSVG